MRSNRINRLLLFPDEQHPYTKNLAKYYEDPDLQQLTAKQWESMSAEEMLLDHDRRQRERLQTLLEQHLGRGSGGERSSI